jgi:hypothetical protein
VICITAFPATRDYNPAVWGWSFRNLSVASEPFPFADEDGIALYGGYTILK